MSENTESTESKPSILLVDDNPLIINVLKNLLTAENYEVFACFNGEEGIEVLDKRTVDVILCDVMMPKMDGYQFHEKVRSQPDLAHIPFIFLTSLGENLDIIKGQESGADEYLVKPVEPKTLLSILRGKIRRSRSIKSHAEQKFDTYRKRIIHTLSHEFKTPLVAINTGTELLIEQHENLDKNRAKSLLQAVQRGGKRLEKLVGDFMTLQQITAGTAKKMYEVKAEKIELKKMLSAFITTKREQLAHDGYDLQCKDDFNNEVVFAYEKHILEIIDRLLHNAVKFSSGSKTILIHAYPSLGSAVIEVRDYGVGMDPAKAKNALEEFGQIDRDKLEQQGGGLGLPIADGLARINGGQLDFESREQGLSAKLVVPLVNP